MPSDRFRRGLTWTSSAAGPRSCATPPGPGTRPRWPGSPPTHPRPVPGTVTLAAAQLAIAREHGYPSWPQLVAEVKARTAEAGQRVEEFLVASIRDWTGRAARMLARDPWIAGYDVRTAVILGDAARVREMLAREPELATRTDTRTGWTALHAACASRWHQLDPARADGLTEVARLLLAAGADPAARPPGGQDGQGGQWSPLLCAVAGAPNPAITRLLLEHGARPDDHVLYLAAFEDDHECLRLLLPYAPDIASTTALSAPISTGDVTGARLMLEAGADPNHLLPSGLLGESHEQEPPVPPLSAAVELEAGAGADRAAARVRRGPRRAGHGWAYPLPAGGPDRAGPGRGAARTVRREHRADGRRRVPGRLPARRPRRRHGAPARPTRAWPRHSPPGSTGS